MKIALLGVGHVGREGHLPAMLRAPGVEVVALVDADLTRARTFAAQQKLEVDVAGRLEDVVDRVDGVIVATPDHTHLPLAMTCCEAGVHMLIEKPLAPSVAECVAIDTAAREAGVTVAVGYVTAFQDAVVAAGQLLATRAFGRPLGFVYQHGARRGWSPDTGPPTSGAMLVSGAHFLHRLIEWFGVPEVLWYEDDARGGPAAVAQARVRCGKGRSAFEGELRVSRTHDVVGGFALRTDRGVFLQTDAGSLRFRPADHPDLEHTIAPRSPAPGTMWDRQLADFVRACRDGDAPRVTAARATEVMALMEAMYAVRRPMVDGFYGAKA